MDERGHITAERLSAYYDGELESKELRFHLDQCPDCRARLDELSRLEQLASALPEPAPARDLWPGIEAAVEAREQPAWKVGALWRSPARRFAAAAALVAVLIGGIVTFGPLNGTLWAPAETAEAFGFDYGAFLTGLNEPPKMEHFDRVYRRQQISIDEALSAAHVTLDRRLIERIPEGLDLEAVYILSNVSAQAVQVTYRHDSSEIAVFKQPDGLPVRFAGYRIEPAAIGSKQCLMVDTGRFCAITFSSGDAQYVVIGRNDDMEVARVIDELLASL